MPTVNGALFSLEASGQLGKAIVYSSWKGRSYVRAYTVPENPRSMAQIFQRAALANLSKWWGALITANKTAYEDLAAAGNYSTFNAYAKYNLDRESINVAPIGAPDGSGEDPQGALTSVTGSSTVGRTDI